MVLENLEPKIVWNIFEHVISSTPRPSKHEELIREKLKTWLKQQDERKSLHLKIAQDDVGNILIKKPPSPRMEGVPSLLLQAHMDMVCETDRIEGFDFFTQGIPLKIQDNKEWVDAEGTTLGADDGIGMALALAILIDKENVSSHGPLEVLFTVNEEDGFTGATGLDVEKLKINSVFMINLDSGDLGEITIGSVGGRRIQFTKELKFQKINDLTAYRLEVSGLKGGHSGGDIHLPRANANKLMSRILSNLSPNYDLFISNWIGGTKANAIPRKAIIEFGVKSQESDDFTKAVEEQISILYDYYKKETKAIESFEPDINISLTRINLTEFLPKDESRNLIDFINLIPNGVLKQSSFHPNFVESSTNLGIIDIHKDRIWIEMYPRSILRNELHAFCRSMEQLAFLVGWEISFRPILAEWNPDLDSPFLAFVKSEYEKILGKPVKMGPTHGGLETATIKQKIPQLEMVAISPTVVDGHSPSEKLKISDVGIIYNVLKSILMDFKTIGS
jgi:dipeptidase D